ncbi:zf-HC2 domain-containing protein [Streptomyces sp. NBC_01275]|uniref:zf-HC2 domain-containing protein n=1 Tax=Streptomyces sp. NBC_01275 TaxID=2903807 RepID=UPI002255A089|nr:zf-HC2 domain-containing protein [Streptomyces sp. NBC_01275]MCX4764927.1 zf-HC2 domain-containing protein [Streptomyces sp. NBC_01275]
MTEHHTRPAPAAPLPSDTPHLPAAWVTAYARGRLGAGLRDGAEAHLLRCPRCADAVENAVRQGPYGVRLDALHRSLMDRVGVTPRPPVPVPAPPSGRPARRLGPPSWFAPPQGLRLSWLAAVACVCGLGVLFGHLSQSPTPRLLLLLSAPVLPVLCVAGSYGGRADPFAEVTRTTPAGGLRILLLRTAQTLMACVPLLTGAAALMPRDDLSPYTSAGWLLPCLTVTLATLLLSSYLGSWTAALTTGCGWLALVYLLAEQLPKPPKGGDGDRMTHVLEGVQLKLLDAVGMTAFSTLSAVLAELLILRRHAFSRVGAR